jgi:hypothetical protein
MRISKDTTFNQIDQAERLNLTIMDQVCCMIIKANLSPKLWPGAAHFSMLV